MTQQDQHLSCLYCMASHKSFAVYITQTLPRDSETALLDELNQSNSQLSLPSDQVDQLMLSVEHAVGMSVKDIVNIHKSRDAIGLHTQINKSLFVVADEGMSPTSYPHTVLIVKPLDVEKLKPSDISYQDLRVLASTAAIVLTAIASGKHGWKDFWQLAQANGGHFPGQ